MAKERKSKLSALKDVGTFTSGDPEVGVEKIGIGNYTVKVGAIEIPDIKGPKFRGGRQGGTVSSRVGGEVVVQGEVGRQATLSEAKYEELFEQADVEFDHSEVVREDKESG